MGWGKLELVVESAEFELEPFFGERSCYEFPLGLDQFQTNSDEMF